MIRNWLLPAYLFLCLCLGGASAGGFAANCLLQLLALPIIGWSLLARGDDPLPPAGRSLLGLTLLLAVFMVLQLVPLPPVIWTRLPGRSVIVDGYKLLGIPLPWIPLSLAPQAAIASALWLLPSTGVLTGMVVLRAFRPILIGAIITAAAVGGVVLGTLQVLGGRGSPWYLYQFTNWGQAVGFFANGNHMATMLVATIPFCVAIQADWLAKAPSQRHVPTILVITWGLLIIVGVGLAINTSLAGIGLGVAASIASVLLLRVGGRRQLAIGVSLTALFLITAITAIFIGPISGKLSRGVDGSQDLEQLTRRVSISKTLEASGRFMPFGSGVGTFRQIYQMEEDPKKTIATYMNHAHSDAAEIVLETGAAGSILILLLLAWWAHRAMAVWRSAYTDYFGRAAVIASGTILAQSFVDYPLRTAAISSVFAACLALMTQTRTVRSVIRGTGSRHLRVM